MDFAYFLELVDNRLLKETNQLQLIAYKSAKIENIMKIFFIEFCSRKSVQKYIYIHYFLNIKLNFSTVFPPCLIKRFKELFHNFG